MLQTRGNKIIDSAGKHVILKGYNLGSWLMLENFMLGYPGVEQELRAHMKNHGGEEKYDFFFERLANAFVTEKDIKFLSGMGCNVVRIPFNYRIFTNEKVQNDFNEKGFEQLDRVIGLCGKYGIYAILDMHSVPGYQNPDWHCDNAEGKVYFYDDIAHQEKTADIWRRIASHYKDEDAVAAYELFNEPVAAGENGVRRLINSYKKIAAAIREADKKHMLMAEGNFWGKTFDGFGEPFDDNVIYSPHYYTVPGLYLKKYPGDYSGESLENKSLLEHMMDERDSYMRKYDVPCLIGEFGLIESNKAYSEDKKRVLADQLDIFEQRGHSWTLWSYKDVGNMGLLNPDPSSAWMQFVGRYLKLKRKYHSDFSPMGGSSWEITDRIRSYYIDDFEHCHAELEKKIINSVSKVFTGILAEDFAKELAAFSFDELDELASSFEVDNCCVREDWKAIAEKHLKA